MEPPKQEPEKKPRRRIKKVKGHGGHHGGAWKVAYADFVTAMMALFLVLWLVSQADTKLKEEIANYFRSPGAFKTARGGVLPGSSTVSKEPKKLSAEAEEEALTGIAEAIRKKFDDQPEFSKAKGKVKVNITEQGLEIQVMDKAHNVSFAVGGSELNQEARTILGEIARAICQLPNPIKIGGHTDARVFPSKNGYSNWELSADRANAARRALQSACVSPDQIKKIVGYADTEQIHPKDKYHPSNRRISITVLRMFDKDGNEETDAKTNEDEESAKVEPNIKESIKIARRTKPSRAKSSKKKKESETEEKTSEDAAAKIAVKKETKPSPKKKVNLEDKLKKEGSVTVGKPDKLPAVEKNSPPKEVDG